MPTEISRVNSEHAPVGAHQRPFFTQPGKTGGIYREQSANSDQPNRQPGDAARHR